MTARARESLPPTFRPMSRSAGCALGRLRSSELAWDVSQLTGQHKAGRPAALAERLTAQRIRSRAWLAEGLRLTKIHRRLAAQGVRIPYSSLHRFARRQWGLGTAAMTARVVEPPSGEVAEVDFGLFGLWPDSTTGHRGQVCGFLVTLGYSRYAFLWLCLRQQRLEQVGFEETATFEQIVWDSPVSFDRARVREPFSPHWLASSRTSSSAVPSAW